MWLATTSPLLPEIGMRSGGARGDIGGRAPDAGEERPSPSSGSADPGRRVQHGAWRAPALPSFSMDAVARGTVYRSAASLTVGLVGVFRQSAEAGARQQNNRAQLRYGDPKLT